MKLTRNTMLLGLACWVASAAFVAPGASAQTAVTCAKEGGSLDFGKEDSHCSKTKVTPGTGEYGHVEFVGATNITATNETTGGAKTTWKLKTTVSGVAIELQATELESDGVMENKTNAGGAMYAHGVGDATFRNVLVTAPAGKGCKVRGFFETDSQETQEKVVQTEELTGTTEGLTNEVKFQPAVAGSPLASFEIFNCAVAALNHTYMLTGSVKGQTSGATVNFTHANTTAQGTLFLFGQKAGIEGSVTFRGPNGNGLTLT